MAVGRPDGAHGAVVIAMTPGRAIFGALWLLTACGDDAAAAEAEGGPRDLMQPAASSSGILTFDASMLARDAGTTPTSPEAGTGLPPAVINADGVLTPYPGIRFSITPPFEILTANFVVTEDGDPRGALLEPYIEVRNTGFATICHYPRSVYLDFVDVATRLNATPHHDQIGATGTPFDSTNPCVAPGAVGVLEGAARGISEADLAVASELHIEYDVEDFGAIHNLATEVSGVTGMVERTAEGFVLRGQITPRLRIWNVGIMVFPRDGRGVLVDGIYAFPGDLGLLPGLVPTPFVTSPTEWEFSEYVAFAAWINDA